MKDEKRTDGGKQKVGQDSEVTCWKRYFQAEKIIHAEVRRKTA